MRRVDFDTGEVGVYIADWGVAVVNILENGVRSEEREGGGSAYKVFVVSIDPVGLYKYDTYWGERGLGGIWLVWLLERGHFGVGEGMVVEWSG